MQCTQCHAEFQDGAKFCPHCGHLAAPVAAAVVCADCQTPLKPGAKFCNHCGATMAAPVTVSAQPSPVSPPVPEPVIAIDPPPEPIPTVQPGAPVSEAVSAGQETKNQDNQALPPLFPAEPATTMGNKVGLWIGLAIAFFAAIGAAVYLFMDNSPSPLKNKIGPMEVPAVSAPAAPAQEPPVAPSSTAVQTEDEAAASLPAAPQPTVVPSVPLPESSKAPEPAEPQPVKRPVNQPKPVVRPVPPPQAEPVSAPTPAPVPAPAPVATGKTCSQASLLMRPICVVEGPATFWKCTPDGKRWNNDIPGCRRSNEN